MKYLQSYTEKGINMCLNESAAICQSNSIDMGALTRPAHGKGAVLAHSNFD